MYQKRDSKPKFGRNAGSRDSRNAPGDPKKKRRKVCLFCANKFIPDYKNIDLMKKFTTERSKIMTQRSSGCCAKHQRMLAKQIKRAREIGTVSYTAE